MIFKWRRRGDQRIHGCDGFGRMAHFGRLAAVLSAYLLTTLLGCTERLESSTGMVEDCPLVVEPAELEVLADRTEVVETSVVLTNKGTVPVDLLSVSTSCGCTTPRPFSQTRLSPGESTKVPIGINPMSYGSRSVSLTVRTSLANQPEIRVPVQIQGPPLNPPYVRYAPSELVVRMEPGGGEQTVRFAAICVERKADGPWLLGCECTLERVRFSAPELIDEESLDEETVKREYQITANLGTFGEEDESLAGRISFKAASPSMRPLPTFLLRLTNEQLIRCIPAALIAKSGTTGSSVFKVVVRSDDDSPFRIESVETDEPRMQVEFDATLDAETHVLRVTLQSIDTRVLVNVLTTHPACRRVSFSVVPE